MRALLALLVCHVAFVAANLRIVPNDSDEDWCVAAGCSDPNLCVLIVKTQEARCLNMQEVNSLIKVLDNEDESSEVAKTHKANHCTRNELMRMGGRLVKWFKDVHSQESGADRTMKLHSVPCRAEVGWMFNQWDGDNDGKLSKSELRPLERGGNEQCVEEFIDMCDDMLVDGSISVDEWCDCFSFSDDLRHEPPCHKAKHDVDPHLLGVFLPRCDLEGFYKPEQCHDGHCWCVDRYGREFDKSRVANSLPDCGQYASDLTEEDVAYLKARF